MSEDQGKAFQGSDAPHSSYLANPELIIYLFVCFIEIDPILGGAVEQKTDARRIAPRTSAASDRTIVLY
jgi:hypothetical protein